MPAEESTAIVRRYYDLLTNHPSDVACYDVVAPDAILREPGRSLQGREAVRQRVADFIAAFPDLRCSIDDIVANDDKVAVRWTLAGTHQGAFGPYPATNKQVTLTGIGLHRVANGQMVEAWGCFDSLGASLQLGANLVLPELATR
jgi:steroid delta-isomerase-like uncharacterized protein